MAYAFLTPDDIKVSLRDVFLNDITDDDQALAEIAEQQCIDKARSYLRSRYNVNALFSATGDDRKPLLVEHITNLFVYRIYTRINPRKMSDTVKDAYHETLDWLEGVAKGKYNPDWPLAPVDPGEETPTSDPLWGGADPLGGHYY